MVNDTESERMILFGGSTGNIEKYPVEFISDETWAYDIGSRSWEKMNPISSPKKMIGHAMAYNSKSDKIVLYGGVDIDSSGNYNVLNQTWLYDYNRNTWIRKADGPPGRFNHRMVYDPGTDKIVIFGGVCFSDSQYSMKYLDETWLYDPDSDEWSETEPENKPGGRHHHGMVYIGKTGYILLWGGRTEGEPDRSIWNYDVKHNTWTESKQYNGPETRGYHAMVYDQSVDRVLVYGGFPALSDTTWIYDHNINNWTIMETEQKPGELSRHCMVYSEKHEKTVLFGGQLDNRRFAYSDAVWLFDSANREWTDLTIRRGEYLGQKKPGDIPELFSPGLVSSNVREHSSPAFTRDGMEMYWSPDYGNYSGEIYSMRMAKGNWKAPEKLHFSSREYRDANPYFSPDNKRLYFHSRRPIGKNNESGVNIWYTDRIGSGWSEPVPVGPPVSLGSDERPVITENGTLYFGSSRDGSPGYCNIFRSELKPGGYTEPELVGGSINTQHSEISSFIAPDESYFIFDSMRPGGYGSIDIYISFRMEDGSWSEAVNMGGRINSEAPDGYASVSPDGKYLFFVSSRNGNFDVYWVNADIINEIREGLFP